MCVHLATVGVKFLPILGGSPMARGKSDQSAVSSKRVWFIVVAAVAVLALLGAAVWSSQRGPGDEQSASSSQADDSAGSSAADGQRSDQKPSGKSDSGKSGSGESDSGKADSGKAGSGKAKSRDTDSGLERRQ